jgi:hypothetical protein
LECDDVLDTDEAARILACAPSEVRGLRAGHRWPESASLTRSAVEELTLARWRLAHSREPGSYWVPNVQAAGILGVNRARVGQLVATGLIPFARARTARRQIVFRRDQLEVVARARWARRPGESPVGWSKGSRQVSVC